MRVLHTADWHLGKTIEGRDRQSEQEQFVEEICRICDDEKVDLVLLAGDVFQTVNPSAAAEDLYYDALDRLAKSGTRGVVVIAGNHDNPERLCAAAPLAERMGITLIGLPQEELKPWSAGHGRVQRIAAGPSWCEIAVPGCDYSAVIAALPYPSEGRLRHLVAPSLDEADLQQSYNELIKQAFGGLAASYRQDTVNLAMSHFYVRGGLESGPESENYIQQVGGVYAVDPASLPLGAQYVAMGHLHRPQTVAGNAARRYAGSPLQYGFAETGQAKSVTLIEVEPQGTASVKEIFLAAGKPLVRWHAREGLSQIYQWLTQGKDKNAWIDAEIHIQEMPGNDELHKLRSMHDGFVNIRLVIDSKQTEMPEADLSRLSPEELFIRFYERQQSGLKPDDGLIKLFLELTQDSDTGETTSGEAGE